MSATFKLAAKQKYSQSDLRRLMQEQKAKTKQNTTEHPKIDSPLAKYNELGQLTCILCKSVVRSESVWKVHLNTKAHKENVAAAKELKDKLEKSSGNQQLKRAATVLANAHRSESVVEKKRFKETSTETNQNMKKEIKSEETSLPSDFFDSSTENNVGKVKIKRELAADDDEEGSIRPKKSLRIDGSTDMDEGIAKEKEDPIPEGFFDDPVRDAKIRNMEYKDPQEEEWEKFQKEIKEESSISNAIITEEQEEATAERQIEEIDEQIQKWSKVLNLEKQKEVISSKLKERASAKMEVDSNKEESASEDEDDKNFDEFLDWRAKSLIRK